MTDNKPSEHTRTVDVDGVEFDDFVPAAAMAKLDEVENVIPDHLRVETTDRGFKFFPPLKTRYATIEVRESSLATEPAFWLRVESAYLFSADGNGNADVTAQLTFDLAQQLIDQLQYLMKHHYQVEFDGN